MFEISRKPLHDPIEEAQRREDLRRLVADVGRLPEQQRSALLMREIDGMSYADLAAALDVTVPAVKSLLVRARIGLVEAAEARDADCAEIRDDLLAAYDRGVKASSRARRHMRELRRAAASTARALRGMRRSFAALSPAGAGPLALAAAKLLGLGGGAAAARPRAAAAAAGGGAAAAGGTAACKVAAVVCAAALTAGGAVEVNHLDARPQARTAARAPKAVAAPAARARTRAAPRPAVRQPAGTYAPLREKPAKPARRRRRRRPRSPRPPRRRPAIAPAADGHRPGAHRLVRRRPGAADPAADRGHRPAARRRPTAAPATATAARGPAGRPPAGTTPPPDPNAPPPTDAPTGQTPSAAPAERSTHARCTRLGAIDRYLEPSTHEELLVRRGRRSGLYTIVAVHSTARGPSLGGCRMWTYADARAAVRDALRLSRAMTFKSAVAGLPLGGGKGVIMLPAGTAPLDRRRRAATCCSTSATPSRRSTARYITAEDVGTSEPDMRSIAEVTRHVTGLAVERGGSGDPSPWTAIGVEAAIRVGCERAFGTDSPRAAARSPWSALGHVGGPLAESLAAGRRDARARRHRRGAARARRPPRRASGRTRARR